MAKKNDLTNEKLTKLYENPFQLVSDAINIAHEVVGTGREIRDGSNRNVASQILNKILKDNEVQNQSQSILDEEKSTSAKSDKDLPDPLLQAI